MKTRSIAIDATYARGADLSGVGVYSRELLNALSILRPEVRWNWLYRPHRFLGSFRDNIPPCARRGILLESAVWRSKRLFHGLNQRLPRRRFPLQVATFHDLFVMTAEYSTKEFRARFSEQARHAAAEADHIIAVSNFTARQVTNLLGVELSRVTVIPHGVRPLPLPQIPRRKIILHVGAIQKRKNLARLVRAFGSVPKDWRLVLAGSNGYGAEETYRAIEESAASERITVTGYVGIEELAQWYARAMIFAFPSLDEGFGMPVLEAMAAGVPVLSSNGSSLGEVAGEAAMLVDPTSEEQIEEGLNALISQPELRRRMVEAGISRAAAFTWENSAKQTLAIYERLLNTIH